MFDSAFRYFVLLIYLMYIRVGLFVKLNRCGV
nr:MAG TPA: hypothetical protein [Siphoviridae sp. ctEci12]DAX80085.1 MAG TPA: hypothetical protein [Caudoviricetes sp.]